jgi:hypothetical protein
MRGYTPTPTARSSGGSNVVGANEGRLPGDRSSASVCETRYPLSGAEISKQRVSGPLGRKCEKWAAGVASRTDGPTDRPARAGRRRTERRVTLRAVPESGR